MLPSVAIIGGVPQRNLPTVMSECVNHVREQCVLSGVRMHWQARLRETVIAEERLVIRLVMTKLEPRQETGHSRHLVVDRLGDSAKRLPEAGARALAVAEPFAACREFD